MTINTRLCNSIVDMETVEYTNYSSALKVLAERYGISCIYAFGSRGLEIAGRARSEHPVSPNTKADVDIGVQPIAGKRLSAREKVEITIALEDLFDTPRVDLVLIPEADPFLALDVIRGELIYCSDLDRQAEDELYILRRAGDLAYYEKERRRLILSGSK